MKGRMHRLDLSFEDTQPASRRLRRWLLGAGAPRRQAATGAALLVSLGLLTTSGWRAIDRQEQLSAARSAHAQRAAAAQATPRPPADAPTRAQASGWNQAVGALGVPWPALLDALERHTPGGVALVSVEPEPLRGRVRLQAEARTLDSLLAYAGTLAQEPGFEDLVVLRHETREQDAARPVRLTFELRLPDAVPGRPR